MNEATLISVHCYGATIPRKQVSWEWSLSGDITLVRTLLRCYEHHKASIVILSPADAPVRVMGPHICRFAGRRGYIGQESLDRQILHLRMLLEYPFEYFLLHDSDSVCISAEIPRILYDSSALRIWSNELTEPRPHTSKYPKLAAQPPYFLNRKSLTALLKIAPQIKAHKITPYIDWAMLAWSCEAGLERRNFAELENPRPVDLNAHGDLTERYGRILNGAVMIHPIKSAAARDRCIAARREYESKQ